MLRFAAIEGVAGFIDLGCPLLAIYVVPVPNRSD